MRILLVLVAVLPILPQVARAQEPKARAVLDAFQNQLATAAATAGPSIACIVVSRSEHYPKVSARPNHPGTLGTFDPRTFLKTDPTSERIQLAKSLDLSDPKSIPDHGYAGGIVIDSAGLILTPYHAIDGATRIYVFLPGGVGSYADIHAADARCDLAVLKLINPPEKMTPIKFAEVRMHSVGSERATVFAGKLVVLMANPYLSNFRLDSPSAAFGSITNIRRRLSNADGTTGKPAEKLASYYKCSALLEHDVKVNGGVTGGALLNLDGELLGLTTSAAVVYNREIGPGYAIPADDNFRRLVDVLRKGEEIEYGFLGVLLPPDTSSSIVLIGVTQNSPAQIAGLRERDVITRINGLPAASFDDLLLQIGSALAGSTIKLQVSRGGREHDVEVTLAKYPNDRPYIASVRREPVFGLRVDFSSIHPIELSNRRFEMSRIAPGVCVRDIVPDSPADKRFKSLGDDPKRWFITQVNGANVSTPAEFYKAAKGHKKLDLTLMDPRDLSGRERELNTSMKYAICNETFEGWEHARVCGRVAELGYTGLEVAPFTLASRITDVSAARRSRLRREAESAGVRIIGLHWLLAKTEGFQLTAADAATRKRTGEYLAELARAAADLGGDILVLGSPVQRNVPEGHTRAEADDFALDTLRYCLPALEQGRVFLCLEPLTPAETSFLNTAAEGVSLIRRLSHPNVRLHLDVKAMSAEAASTPDVIRANRDFLHHFHANDPNKRGPGFGETDFKPIFQAVRDVNYAGWISVEVFDYSPDPDTIARQSIRYMRECEPS